MPKISISKTLAKQAPKLTALPQAMSIAREIHLTYPNKVNMPAPLQENVANIARLNPDYKINIYDDADIQSIIRNEFGSAVLETYDLINRKYGAARADLFRYLCVYRFGGVYIDIKSRMTRPLREVLLAEDRYILAQWDPEVENGRFASWGLHAELSEVAGGEYQQWHVIASAGHPFLKAVCDNVLERIVTYSPLRMRSGRYAVIRTTGPIVYTQSIHPLLNQAPHRFVKVERDLGIHYSIYTHDQSARHTSLFANHYSTLTEPLVPTNPVVDGLYNGYHMLRRTARYVRDRMLNKQASSPT